MKRSPLARDVMVTRLVTLSPRMHVFDGIAHLLKHDLSGAPVVDDGRRYLGVFSEKCCTSVLTRTAELPQATGERPRKVVRAKDFMVRKLVTFAPDLDVFEAIGSLLEHEISGAPVIDEEDRFLGVFSERDSMRVLIDAAYDQLPTSTVLSFANRDRGRLIDEDRELVELAHLFLETHYRRLVVVRDERVVGQISRRDVLRAQHHLTATLRDREQRLLENSEAVALSDEWDEPWHGRLPSPELANFMDTRARTIGEETGLLDLVQIFRQTNYRRLPVLREGRLVGQVSRKDVLKVTHEGMAVAPERANPLLYLSALVGRDESPIE